MLPSDDTLTDQPIPNTMVGKLGTWSSRAMHYPIFSPTWFKYRIRGFLVPMCIFTAFIVLLGFIMLQESLLTYALLSLILLYFAVVIALLMGRWLAVKVRSRSRRELWSQKKEAIGVSLAIGIGIVIASLCMATSKHLSNLKTDAKITNPDTTASSTNNGSTEAKANRNSGPFGVIETTNTESKTVVDPNTKKTTYVGVKTSTINPIATKVIDIVMWSVIMIWLSGVFDLRAYFKQRGELEQAIVQEKLDRYKRERNQAEMRLSVLASQVEPHFLFNTLSGVRSAMLSDPERGVLIIDHLVNYLRSTIPQMRSDGTCTESTLRMQLESIRSYLGVMHVRIPRLSFNVDGPDDLLDLTVPPLMLISLVENAVKHGIEPKKGPVHIAISAYKIQLAEGEKLAISVKDNGVGFGGSAGKTSGTGIGLSNIRERLKQLYDDQASLSLLAVETGGVEAILSLPINHPLDTNNMSAPNKNQ